MKKIICILFSALLLVACGTTENTQNYNNNTNSNEAANNENVGQTQNIDDSREKENNSTSIEEKEFYLIDEIINNIGQFDGKKVTVKGSLGMGPSLSDDGRTIMRLNEIDGDSYIELEDEMPMQGLCEVLVSGTIVKKEYGITIQAENYNYEVSDSPAINFPDPVTEFSNYKDAAVAFNNLNWNQLYLNPTSLAHIDNIFIAGNVEYLDVNNGITELLLQTNQEGTDDTLIYAYITEEVYDIHNGDFLIIRGNIEDVEAGYNRNGREYPCASICVWDYIINGRKEVFFDSLTDEEKNFMYGEYSQEGNDYNIFDGYFKFSNSTIGDYTYTVDSMSYSFGTFLVSTRDYHTNNPRLSMTITVNVPEYENPLKISLGFNLVDNSVHFLYIYNGRQYDGTFNKVN